MNPKKNYQKGQTLKEENGKKDAQELIERLNRISFWEMLIASVKIEIPIVQRDYVQGRTDHRTTKVRQNFLDSIIRTLSVKDEGLELDLVFGDNQNDVFQPLDGQQRLTTLFLLHWFVAFKTGNLKDNLHQFKKFTYETRISSREFCHELVEQHQDLGEGECISDQIIDAYWFDLSWRKDPTIKAMLVMLDSIEAKLKTKTNKELTHFWKQLTSVDAPITFHFKSLNDIGLTDDLYIKMNARGKQLTDLENFKARFEKYIKDNEFEKHLALSEADDPQSKEKIKGIFSHRIDTYWMDLFWKYRGADDLVDQRFIHFITGIAIIAYADKQMIFKSDEEDEITKKELEAKTGTIVTEEAIKKERIRKRIQLLAKQPQEIQPADFPTGTTFEYLKSCFNLYADKDLYFDELRPENLSLWELLKHQKIKIEPDHEIENTLFTAMISEANTGYKQKVLFYAQTEYLLKTEDPHPTSFAYWMRVVRNIVQNANIDSPASFMAAIECIRELSTGCADIYSFLDEHSFRSGFASKQLREEVVKARLIIEDPEAITVIHQTEDSEFCKGRIEFPLFCVDVDLDKEHQKALDVDQLEQIYRVIQNNFQTLDQTLSDEFKRAFLTIGNNDYYKVWGAWSYSLRSQKGWLLHKTKDLKQHFSTRKGWKSDYLKALFLLLRSYDYVQIIDNYKMDETMPNWKQRLIKEDDLLQGASYILIPEQNTYCRLAWQQRPNKTEQTIRIDGEVG